MNFLKSRVSKLRLTAPARRLTALGCASVFALSVSGCGGSGNTVVDSAPQSIAPVSNSAPIVNSAAKVSLTENSAAAFYSISATDPENDAISTVEIIASGDGRFFKLDPNTMQIAPAAAFDFEQTTDLDLDNVYDIEVKLTDSRGASTIFPLNITVKDVPDNFSYGLQRSLSPAGNFDLLDWKLDLPVNEDGEPFGDNLTIDEDHMALGYSHPDFFYTGPDGGMVFSCPPRGARTSSGTRYARTELREMLRRGDRSIKTKGAGDRPNGNNWAFSSAPQSALDDAGGIDGDLKVTLAVNEVTTTGDTFQIGRLIIGQIHAKDDEPLRLYYRKLPGNSRGSIYAAHESAGGDEVYYNLIGSRSSSQSNPDDGILLGETFTYSVEVSGHDLTIRLTKANGQVFVSEIDMTDSGYDVDNDYMYFKVGVYHVNDLADDGEVATMTVYALENKHQDYAH